MKNSAACARKLNTLRKNIKLPDEDPPHALVDNPVENLILSYMLWEATTTRALTALDKIRNSVVDLNELRVTEAADIARWIGSRYPLAMERCERMRATLREIFQREHGMELLSLEEEGKREIRRYFETLNGIPAFVADRVLLINYETHAVPVDGRIRKALIANKAADRSASVDDLTNWLYRQVKAEEALQTYYQLQDLADNHRSKRSGSSSKRKSSAANKGQSKGQSKSSSSRGRSKAASA